VSIFSWGTNDLRLMFAIASSKTTILAEAVIVGDDYLGHDDYYSGDDDNYNEDHNNNYNTFSNDEYENIPLVFRFRPEKTNAYTSK